MGGLACLWNMQSNTLNSPQGDGNAIEKQYDASNPRSQTPSIPRKGTETFYTREDALAEGRQTPSIPRKGTETEIPTTC